MRSRVPHVHWDKNRLLHSSLPDPPATNNYTKAKTPVRPPSVCLVGWMKKQITFSGGVPCRPISAIWQFACAPCVNCCCCCSLLKITGQFGFSGAWDRQPQHGGTFTAHVRRSPTANLYSDAPRLLSSFCQLVLLQETGTVKYQQSEREFSLKEEWRRRQRFFHTFEDMGDFSKKKKVCVQRRRRCYLVVCQNTKGFMTIIILFILKEYPIFSLSFFSIRGGKDARKLRVSLAMSSLFR